MLRLRPKILVAAGLLAVGLVSVPTGQASASSGVCDPTGEVCMWVTNDYAGSNHITSIRVYNSRRGGTETMRWLRDQQVQNSATGNMAYPGHTFNVDIRPASRTCIQGGIVNIARTDCWYVP